MNTTFVKKPKVRIRIGTGYRFVSSVTKTHKLKTVCEEARCPNIYECWDRRTATIMILGDICTRACGFCSIKTGKPTSPDPTEPIRTALAVKKMQLHHVVITSVDRDDLKYDYGSTIWADTIRQIRKYVPGCTVEILTPDFKGYLPAIRKVITARPDIFSHNLECVKRISKRVRPQAIWQRNLAVLQQSVNFGLLTKTGIMVGIGETTQEVLDTMKQVVDLGVKIFTIGQYLRPTKKHLPVARYVEPDEFLSYKKIGLELGFKIVESGPLIRSSYRADKQARWVLD